MPEVHDLHMSYNLNVITITKTGIKTLFYTYVFALAINSWTNIYAVL